MLWYDAIQYDTIWYDATWYGRTYCHVQQYTMYHNALRNAMPCHAMTWHDVTWDDMLWHDVTWRDMTWLTYLLTGGSLTFQYAKVVRLFGFEVQTTFWGQDKPCFGDSRLSLTILALSLCELTVTLPKDLLKRTPTKFQTQKGSSNITCCF